MAAYETLRAAIDSYIKANGNKEITGTVLNDILNAMVSALGANTRFAGVAVPSTNPGNPEGNVVYFASQAGTYSNFGGIVLPLGIHILVWNGTAWTSQTWFSVNSTPTQNSQNLVTSGGIFQAIVDAVGVERLRAIGAEVTSCSFNSTTKKVSFFNSANSTLFQLDATAFIIDGMVSDVKIEDGNLIIKFNTDAGKQDIEIPLTEIFDPANYYTKTAIDTLLTAINNKLADGCLYRGMAEPTTNPPTPTTKVFYIATKAGTYTNFGNIAVTEGITILKYDGSNWSKEQICYSDGVFDISAYNGTSYADLSAALGTNGANIPQNLRKGGMSVKFVQSSDNKYVQYRLMTDEFTTDTTQWATADEGVYVENPEFIYVKTDAEGKILWAIKIDGGIYYGVGVPQQVIDYINEKIAEFSIEDIVAFLNDLEKGDKTLQDLLNEKVDKVEGKSLIDSEVADNISFNSNDEYLEVETDSDGKMLSSRSNDGSKNEYIGFKTPKINIGGAEEYMEDNPEGLIEVITDKDDKMLSKRDKDGVLHELVGIESPTIDAIHEDCQELHNELNSLDGRVTNTETHMSNIITVEGYNQVRDDKCNNNVDYLVCANGDIPFGLLRAISNGKFIQNTNGRNTKAKINLFGDTHFGREDGNPTNSVRCGMAFEQSNQKNSDFSLIMGDVLTDDATAEAGYELYFQKLRKLDTPCFSIEGNHDEEITVIKLDSLIKTGVIQFNGVRVICFNAKIVYPEGYHTDMGDVQDDVYDWLEAAIKDSYDNECITILVCHYALAFDEEDILWDEAIRRHRDDIISLCQQYDVKLYLNGHEHTSGLNYKIVENQSTTLDMTDVLIGRTAWTYSVMEIKNGEHGNGFYITEYDTVTDNVLHTLFIPMTNQASGTIFN